jgi:L-asparaginase
LENYGADKTIYDYDQVLSRCNKYGVEFDKIRPIFTLSENMSFALLNRLLDALFNIDYSAYIGVIITHGTDTLAYTANLISMMFSHKGIPFVLVSSNHPLSDVRANGVANFEAALDFICTAGFQGAYVIYRDYSGITEVHLASRVKQMNQIVDAYESFKNIYFGTMVNGRFYRNDDLRNPNVSSIIAAKDIKGVKKLHLTKTVMMIYPYVGLRHDMYNIGPGLDAVVYGVYHSGTFFSHNEYPDNSINRLVEKLNEFNIPMYISEVSSLGDKYASAAALESNDAVNIVYDTSIENLYTKVTIAFDMFDNIKDRNNYIKNENVFFEKVINM